MIDVTIGKPLPNTAGLHSNNCRQSVTPLTGPWTAEWQQWQHGQWVRDYRLAVQLRTQPLKQTGTTWTVCSEVQRVMMIVRVVAACPVSRVVLTFGMPMHGLQPQKRFTTHVALVSLDVHASTAPVHHSQLPQQFASTREHHRTAPVAVTSLWMVPPVRQRLASWQEPQCCSSAAAINKKLHACSLRWWWG